MYLGYCISDCLSEIYGFIHFKMCLVLISFGIFYRMLKEIDDEKTQSAIFYSIPLLTLLILLVIRWHLKSIFSYLVPEVSKPELINFQVDIDVIDPFDHYENMQPPPFLEDTEPKVIDDSFQKDKSDKDSGTDEEDSEFEITKRPKDSPKPSGLNDTEFIKDSAVSFVENHKKSINRWMFKSGKKL